jgi:serine/threonine protein kinase
VAIKLARIIPLRQDGLDREFEIGRLLPEGDNRFGFPRMIEYGTYQGHHFLVTELLGPSVENLLQYCGGGLSVKTIVMIARKTILCLEQMHTRGLIHRDIKPHNIVLSDKGNKVFLIDFGLSQALDPGAQQQQFAGTPIFSAPTALNNERESFSPIHGSCPEFLLIFRPIQLLGSKTTCLV